MNMPNVAPNYPQTIIPPPTITLQVNVTEESLWLHKQHEHISAHLYSMVMDLSCLQMGARSPDADEDLLLQPAVFQTSKGLTIHTGRFGDIRFPLDFEMAGII